MFLKELKLLLKNIFENENYYEVRDISKSDKEYKFLVVVDQELIDQSLKTENELFEAIKEIINFRLVSDAPDSNLEIIFEVYNGL